MAPLARSPYPNPNPYPNPDPDPDRDPNPTPNPNPNPNLNPNPNPNPNLTLTLTLTLTLLRRAVRTEEASRPGRQPGAADRLAEQRGGDEADDHQVGDALGSTEQAERARWQPTPASEGGPHAWVCSLSVGL